jgi:hypothetical protein
MNTSLLLAWLFFGFAPVSGYAQVPTFFRQRVFNCDTLADAVNHYVAMGEGPTLREFAALTSQGDISDSIIDSETRGVRIGIVCAILFKPRTHHALGTPNLGWYPLPRETMPAKDWPLFPVVASGSSYFVLSDQTVIAGVSAPWSYTLDDYRTYGRFLRVPIPHPTRAQALADLGRLKKTRAWKAIRWSRHKPHEGGASYDFSESVEWASLKDQAMLIPMSRR